jgi:uncharacterized protein (UPF0335 family)
MNTIEVGPILAHTRVRETDDVSGGQLRAFIERIERLQSERKALSDDIAEVYAEAKGCGFSTPALREVIKRRGTDKDKLDEHETLVDLYLRALGEDK